MIVESQRVGTSYERTDAEKASHATQKERILNMLRNAENGVSASELKVVTHRFSAAIKTLRSEGHVIDRDKTDDGENFWIYIKKVDVIEVTDEWKDRYYKSSHWQHMRYMRRQFDNHICCHCKSTSNLHVHHWCYELFDEDIADLMTLCESCHERIHGFTHISFPSAVTPEVNQMLATDFMPHGAVEHPKSQRSMFDA